MVEAKALSVETVDSKVLNLAREDIVWHSVSELITDVPDKEMPGLNIVEFAGDDAALIDQQVTTLCQRLIELMAASEAGVIGWQVCHDLEGVSASMPCARRPSACWAMPKAPPSPIPSPRTPAYRPNIWRGLHRRVPRAARQPWP